MLIFIVSLSAIMLVVLYIGGIVCLTGELMDWCIINGYPEFLIPWLFAVLMLIAVPISATMAVNHE